jgi:multisubunit Na+/H+ antiporter MnhE subunit
VTRYVAAVALLTLVYALALASFSPFDLLFGALLSAALAFFSRGFVFGEDSGRGRRFSGGRWPSCRSRLRSSGRYSGALGRSRL